MINDLFKMFPRNYLLANIFIIYKHTENRAQNNLQELIYYKTQLINQPNNQGKGNVGMDDCVINKSTTRQICKPCICSIHPVHFLRVC